jgi:hypothetical protein
MISLTNNVAKNTSADSNQRVSASDSFAGSYALAA